jgi:hypothetical protein
MIVFEKASNFEEIFYLNPKFFMRKLKYTLFNSLFLVILCGFPALAQSRMEAKSYVQDCAEALMKQVCPISGHNARYEVHDIELIKDGDGYAIEMTAYWDGSPCLLFEVKGFLYVNRITAKWAFKLNYKNSAVTDAEWYNGALKLAIGAAIVAGELNKK